MIDNIIIGIAAVALTWWIWKEMRRESSVSETCMDRAQILALPPGFKLDWIKRPRNIDAVNYAMGCRTSETIRAASPPRITPPWMTDVERDANAAIARQSRLDWTWERVPELVWFGQEPQGGDLSDDRTRAYQGTPGAESVQETKRDEAEEASGDGARTGDEGAGYVKMTKRGSFRA